MEDRLVLHSLIDRLPDEELVAAQRFLEYLEYRRRDPLRVLLENAPLDDEPLTKEDLDAIQEGLDEKARGDIVSHEEAERLLLGSK